MSRKGEVALMIFYIRQRSGADGKPLDDVTDWEINHYGIGVEYIMPEIRADIAAGIRRFSGAAEPLNYAMESCGRAVTALGEALSREATVVRSGSSARPFTSSSPRQPRS
jgi:hypothetical protein